METPRPPAPADGRDFVPPPEYRTPAAVRQTVAAKRAVAMQFPDSPGRRRALRELDRMDALADAWEADPNAITHPPEAVTTPIVYDGPPPDPNRRRPGEVREDPDPPPAGMTWAEVEARAAAARRAVEAARRDA